MIAVRYLVGVLLSALATEPEVEIQSDSECPGAQAVKSQLQLLMPDARHGSVRISKTPDGIEMALHSAQQSWPLRRVLPQHPSCEQLARMAAAVIATWQATVQQAPAPPAPPREGRRVAKPAPPPRRLGVELSASIVGALSGAQLALVQQLDVRLALGESGFGARLGARIGTPHSLAVGLDRVEWTRWSLHAQPGMHFVRDGWHVEISGAAALALVDVVGRGFERNHRSFGLDCGLGGGLRMGRSFGQRAPAVWPFFGLDLMGWLVPQVARSTSAGTPEQTALPQLDLLFSIGAAVADLRARGPLKVDL